VNGKSINGKVGLRYCRFGGHLCCWRRRGRALARPPIPLVTGRAPSKYPASSSSSSSTSRRRDPPGRVKYRSLSKAAKDLPLANISAEGTNVGFDLPGIPGNPKFQGQLSDDGQTIAGDFTQSGQTFPFSMERAQRRGPEAVAALEGFDEFLDQAIKDWRSPGLAVGVVVLTTRSFMQGLRLS